MKPYLDALNTYLAENAGAYGHPEIKSMLDVLYYRFCVLEGLDTEKIRSRFCEFADLLRPLSQQDRDRIFDIVCDLCEKYQHEAFRQGLVIGFRLFSEAKSGAG